MKAGGAQTPSENRNALLREATARMLAVKIGLLAFFLVIALRLGIL